MLYEHTDKIHCAPTAIRSTGVDSSRTPLCRLAVFRPTALGEQPLAGLRIGSDRDPRSRLECLEKAVDNHFFDDADDRFDLFLVVSTTQDTDLELGAGHVGV